jgi:hypothetical protein
LLQQPRDGSTNLCEVAAANRASFLVVKLDVKADRDFAQHCQSDWQPLENLETLRIKALELKRQKSAQCSAGLVLNQFARDQLSGFCHLERELPNILRS